MAATMGSSPEPGTLSGPGGVAPGAPAVHPSPHPHHASSRSLGGGAAAAVPAISSRPTLIATPRLRFLIMDAPRQANLHLYVRECQRHAVADIVRVCEPTYMAGELTSAGIAVHEMAYPDGHSPPEDVLDRWLALVEKRGLGLGGGGPGGKGAGHDDGGGGGPRTVAVHCVAGLGRAPVLVAIALMEFEGMDAVEAVTAIRHKRRGAINEKQLRYLEGYRPRRRAGGAGCGCAVM